MSAPSTRRQRQPGELASRPAVVAACVSVAALSTAMAAALTFDPWAWLVWGREVGRLDLDTTGGPSWKPLPVAVTAVVAPLGQAAVPLALVIARTGTLLAVAATYRLATRVAGRAAGAVAAVLLVLTPDADPRFLRLFGEGHATPTSAACALFAVEYHLDGRRGRALALAVGAALLRPEAWPLLGLYALWLWRDEPRLRGAVAASVVAVPLLWFVPDWLGSGSALNGADAAQVGVSSSVGARTLDALEVAWEMVALPVWVLAGWALWSARRRREPLLAALAAGAAAWSLLVVGMAATLGYAALSRFFLPAAAAVCVLAGVGTAWAVESLMAKRQPALAAAGGLVAIALLVPRLSGLPEVAEELRERARAEQDLDRVLDQVPPEVLFACDELTVDGVGLLRTGVAWKLDVPLHRVPRASAPDPDSASEIDPSVAIVRTGGSLDEALSPQGEEVLRSHEWVVLGIDCPAATPTD